MADRHNNQIDRRTPLQTKDGSLSPQLGKPTYDGVRMTSDSEKMHSRENQPYSQREFEPNVQVPERKGREWGDQQGRVRTKRLEVCVSDFDHTPFFYVGYEREDSINGTGKCMMRIRGASGTLLEADQNGIIVICNGKRYSVCDLINEIDDIKERLTDIEDRLTNGGL